MCVTKTGQEVEKVVLVTGPISRRKSQSSVHPGQYFRNVRIKSWLCAESPCARPDDFCISLRKKNVCQTIHSLPLLLFGSTVARGRGRRKARQRFFVVIVANPARTHLPFHPFNSEDKEFRRTLTLPPLFALRAYASRKRCRSICTPVPFLSLISRWRVSSSPPKPSNFANFSFFSERRTYHPIFFF